MSFISVLGNIVWILFGGLELAIAYFIGGLILCCTIIGIPFGIQAFKIGVFAFLPFGNTFQYTNRTRGCLSTIMNIVWALFFGLIIAFIHLICGILLCVTILGIPLGIQHFKLMGLAVAPFGAEIVPNK